MVEEGSKLFSISFALSSPSVAAPGRVPWLYTAPSSTNDDDAGTTGSTTENCR
jgi:hypothetical protein